MYNSNMLQASCRGLRLTLLERGGGSCAQRSPDPSAQPAIAAYPHAGPVLQYRVSKDDCVYRTFTESNQTIVHDGWLYDIETGEAGKRPHAGPVLPHARQGNRRCVLYRDVAFAVGAGVSERRQPPLLLRPDPGLRAVVFRALA